MPSIVLTDEEYGGQLAQTLNLLRIEQKWTDCCLETKGGKVHVHQVILAAVVEKHQITKLILTGSQQTSNLKDFSEHIVETFITYLYTGNLNLRTIIEIKEFIRLCKQIEFTTLLSHKAFHEYLVSDVFVINVEDTRLKDSKKNPKKDAHIPYPIYLHSSHASQLVLGTGSIEQKIDNASQGKYSSVTLPNPISTTSHDSEPVSTALPRSISTVSHDPGEQVPSSSQNIDSNKCSQQTDQSDEMTLIIKEEILSDEDLSFTSHTDTRSDPTVDTLMTSLSSIEKQNVQENANELDSAIIKNTSKEFRRANVEIASVNKNKSKKISSTVLSAEQCNKESEPVAMETDTTNQDKGEMDSIVPTDEIKVEQESDTNNESTSIFFDQICLPRFSLEQATDSCTIQEAMEIERIENSTDTEEEKNKDEEMTKKKGEIFKCQECLFSTRWRSSIFRHKMKHNKESMHKCEQCPSKFPDESLLRDHVKVKHKDGLLCSHCSKIFTSRPGLSYHLKKISGEFNHQCPYCDKTFIGKQQFDSHVNKHRDYKPFKCDKCERRFYYSFNLSSHKNVCSKSKERKDIKCELCDMVFFSTAALRNHKTGKHGNTKYICSTCGNSYNWAASYYRHIKSHK